MAHRQFCLIADKIEADPALMEIPLANITRWLGNGHRAFRELCRWWDWIQAAQQTPSAMKRLLDLLRDDSEEARDWKGYDPFPGVLDDEELAPLLWTSRH